MSEMTKIYTHLRTAVAELEEARQELAKRANLRVGMISGGPSIDEETAEFERCARHVCALIRNAVALNGRRSAILSAVGNTYEAALAEQLLDDRKFTRALAAQRACTGVSYDRDRAFERVMNGRG